MSVKEKNRYQIKTNNLLLADYKHLVQHFCYRCLQMWSADCRRLNSEKQTIP
ncbi:hypothetical protein Hanom_Chr06g00497131 [Helianthus anomalus]